MTSRERLLTALRIEEPDRVPISCYELTGWDLDNWYNRQPSYKNLMDLIRQQTDCVSRPALPAPSLGNPATDVTGETAARTTPDLETDTWREGNSTYARTTYHTPKGDLTSLTRTDDDVFTVWTIEHPLKTIDDIDKYLSIPFHPGDADMTDFARRQRELGDKGILMPSISDAICFVAELFEMGRFLVYALTETDRIQYFLDALHERNMAYLKAVLESGKRAGVNFSEVTFRICGPEYATPPYLSPQYFARFVTPYLIDMSRLLHEYGAQVRIHCHGKIGKVLDQIMQCDPQGIDPLEPPPDGDIELDQVKRRIGDRCCLYGNLEMKLLEHGSADDVRQAVIQCMQQAKRGGGYVIMPTAGPINVPLSPKTEHNYRVFIETALEHGRY